MPTPNPTKMNTGEVCARPSTNQPSRVKPTTSTTTVDPTPMSSAGLGCLSGKAGLPGRCGSMGTSHGGLLVHWRTLRGAGRAAAMSASGTPIPAPLGERLPLPRRLPARPTWAPSGSPGRRSVRRGNRYDLDLTYPTSSGYLQAGTLRHHRALEYHASPTPPPGGDRSGRRRHGCTTRSPRCWSGSATWERLARPPYGVRYQPVSGCRTGVLLRRFRAQVGVRSGRRLSLGVTETIAASSRPNPTIQSTAAVSNRVSETAPKPSSPAHR